ncbi:hypothetical protein [Streptomyces sp. NPDC054940]
MITQETLRASSTTRSKPLSPSRSTSARVVHPEAVIRGECLELVVRDDGTGGAEPGRGSGLIGLVDRVEAIGGKLDITSRPGEGTTMDVRLLLSGPTAEG